MSAVKPSHKLGLQIATLLTLPPGVILSACLIDPQQAEFKQEFFVDISECPYLAGMGSKRKTEFLSGRLCAAQSLEAMGVRAPFPLPVCDRLPVWPVGVVGSISHCNSMALAITAHTSDYQALGVDAELLLDIRGSSEIRNQIGCDHEWSRLEKYTTCQRHAVTRLFSAKEALYKALFPSIGHFKDFDAAKFSGYKHGAMFLQLTHDWAPCWPKGRLIKVHQCRFGQTVISAVCIA